MAVSKIMAVQVAHHFVGQVLLTILICRLFGVKTQEPIPFFIIVTLNHHLWIKMTPESSSGLQVVDGSRAAARVSWHKWENFKRTAMDPLVLRMIMKHLRAKSDQGFHP